MGRREDYHSVGIQAPLKQNIRALVCACVRLCRRVCVSVYACVDEHLQV